MLNLQLIEQSMAERGLNGTALAQKCGVSKEAVSNWLSGESVPRPSKWAALAAALGIGVQELVFKSAPAFPEPLVAFTGRGPRTSEAVAIAQDMGGQLRQLLPFMHPAYSARQLVGPTLDEKYVPTVALGLREQVGASSEEPLSQEQLLRLLKDASVILVPVFWEPPQSGGLNTEGFENAVSICLPDSGTVWALINVGSPAAEVRYSLAHVLGRCLTLQSLPGQEGEVFADMLARVLLKPGEEDAPTASFLTTGLLPPAALVSESLSKGARPLMRDLVHQGARVSGTPVFKAFAQWQRSEGGRSPAFIAAALNMGLGDSIELSHAVMEL